MKTELELIPYGEISSRLVKAQQTARSGRARLFPSSTNARQRRSCIFVTFSRDLDASFVKMFRQKAKADSRLLILNSGSSTDHLMSCLVDLQIRATQRFYIIDTPRPAWTQGLLKRLISAHTMEDRQERILDARIDEGFLHLISSNFNRLDVPVDQVPEFKKQDLREIKKFEIDEDGAFIYWPGFDLHLGWKQLEQLVNPAAALRSAQKSREFNRRYGKAVQKIRQQKHLELSDIDGLSEKQLRRIEHGECRLTANAMEVLAKAHKLAPNAYLKKLADALAN